MVASAFSSVVSSADSDARSPAQSPARRPQRNSSLAAWAETAHGWLETLNERVGPLVDFLVRFFLAQTFFTSGVLKASSWQTTLQLYTYEHPVPGLSPFTAAVIGTGIELICPILLVFGLFTRMAALPLLATALFLQLTYQSLDTHIFWMILLGLLFVRGPGAISLDHIIGPHLSASPLPFARSARCLAAITTRWGTPPVSLIARVFVFMVVVKGAMIAWPNAGPAHSTALVMAVALSGFITVGFGTRIASLALLPLVSVLPFLPDSDDPMLLSLVLGMFVTHGASLFSIDAAVAPPMLRFFPSLAPDEAWLKDAPRVVIIGAGFGGLTAARALRHAWARVTLIDRRNYHLFQPLLYQVATASLSPADIATPIRAILRGQANCQVLMARVTGVDVEERKVIAGDRRIDFDYLILATGAKHSYFGKDEWESVAPGLKKIDDATAMRGHILSAFERAETSVDEDERRRLMTFVIVGGGPTGVELAGAIAELAHHGMEREFRTINPADARVILVQSASRVLPVMPESLSEKAKQSLEGLGVDVLLNARVEQIDEQGVRVGDMRIEAATVLWAAGVAASAAGRWIGANRDRAGRIVVDVDLSVPSMPGVLALGDTAACPDVDGKPLPGLAAVAQQQGAHAARRIRALIEGRRDPGAFHYVDRGSMATIGRKSAVAALPHFRLSGALAWWLWSAVHVAFLVDVRSRVAVMFDWFWSYLTYNRGMRLITGSERQSD